MVEITADQIIDRIPLVDKDLEAEREAKRKAEKLRGEGPPPIDPLTGKPAELISGRPKDSSYPGRKPPRPNMPMGGAMDD